MIPWVRIVLAFLFCIAVAVAAILVLRRRQGMPPAASSWFTGWLPPAIADATPPPALQARLRVSPASQIVVLAWEDAQYLIHVSAAGAQLLDRRVPADGAA